MRPVLCLSLHRSQAGKNSGCSLLPGWPRSTPLAGLVSDCCVTDRLSERNLLLPLHAQRVDFVVLARVSEHRVSQKELCVGGLFHL